MFLVKRKKKANQPNKNKPQQYRRVLRYEVKAPLFTSLTTPTVIAPQSYHC